MFLSAFILILKCFYLHVHPLNHERRSSGSFCWLSFHIQRVWIWKKGDGRDFDYPMEFHFNKFLLYSFPSRNHKNRVEIFEKKEKLIIFKSDKILHENAKGLTKDVKNRDIYGEIYKYPNIQISLSVSTIFPKLLVLFFYHPKGQKILLKQNEIWLHL